MPRIRGIKPDFFKDEHLAELSFEARLLFAGLWCYADKMGRLEDRPKYLKAEIFPYDKVDIEKLLNILAKPKITERPEKIFIVRYEVNRRKYIEIPEFSKHQTPHHTEKESMIPKFNGSLTVTSQEDTVPDTVPDTVQDTVIDSFHESTAEPEKKSGSTVDEWGDDQWLYILLKNQKYLNGEYKSMLFDHDWWNVVSMAVNGISEEWLNTEFAKMKAWMIEKPTRVPTKRGIKRFVRGWLERAYERERRK